MMLVAVLWWSSCDCNVYDEYVRIGGGDGKNDDDDYEDDDDSYLFSTVRGEVEDEDGEEGDAHAGDDQVDLQMEVQVDSK